MIATVTLNPAIDKSITVRGFGIGKTNRGEVDRIDAGGKGINVAKALRRWGSSVFALGLWQEATAASSSTLFAKREFRQTSLTCLGKPEST